MKKQFTAAALCAAMAMAVISIPAAADDACVTTYGEKQFDDVNIKVEIFDRSNAPEGSTVTDNKWVDYINEEMGKVGIHVDMVAVPRWEETTKMQVMMASNTAPDIIFTYNRSVAEDYYQKGGIYQLNDYIDGEDQARNLKAYIGEDILDLCRTEDGELWGITAKRTGTAKYNLFIREDWVEAVGMDMPTTPDELYDVLMAIKEQNPGGRNDLIPFFPSQVGSAVITLLAESFMESVADETQLAISSFCPVYSDKGYVEYLRYLNKLYNDGLIDPEYYTKSNGYEDMANGRLACTEGGYGDNVVDNRHRTLNANDPDARMVALPALENVNDGVQYGQEDTPNGMYIIIPRTCRNVEAAITYLDWMATDEGGYVLYNGFEGEHYELVNGKPVAIDAEYNSSDKNWINMDIFVIGMPGYFTSKEDMIETRLAMYPGFEDIYRNDFEAAEVGTLRQLSSYVSPTQQENYSDIFTVMQENQVICITCAPEEFDDAIADYIDALTDAGMDQVLEERTEYFTQE